ncbi:hypothetical protein Ae168Ps1_2584 [Pseudonocardia sp. Ae168_Ps1]|uniref:hypothetical protein n=1 Tax=unclassified Pseudonocardia TaxID=2619320 RepID=UPI00094AE663|nr:MULTISPECIES: hypothetical protein [unclassified Pseudonocardia]OLL74196.1 hypothetical protein Ae150APs1_2574 [Pseudonocardia sp. Ae150A_Ps1]OLL80178.1 hypothetical protein Ae168Ps1_2584 [Pseudonocardia sp. Ae168_Ps1]OLL85694.1 hypothetical protein Ae263Ps1_2749c [Pseudonocardia sp. Ae263_Ps1]OLL94276.1 hypothetical protein Ae356Ps1_4173 [Pseudonocardia sp. Ae356_Ps1]
MLMTHIPMDHLVALAEDRQRRLRQEAEHDRLVRVARGISRPRRLLRWLTGGGRAVGAGPHDPRPARPGAGPGAVPPPRSRPAGG